MALNISKQYKIAWSNKENELAVTSKHRYTNWKRQMHKSHQLRAAHLQQNIDSTKDQELQQKKDQMF